MSGPSQKTLFRTVATIDIWMHQPGNDSELVPQMLQRFQIGSDFVVFARFLWEEIRSVNSEWRVDRQHPAIDVIAALSGHPGNNIDRLFAR